MCVCVSLYMLYVVLCYRVYVYTYIYAHILRVYTARVLIHYDLYYP